MKTVFGSFRAYADAQAAVDELLENDFESGGMNVLVLERDAKGYIDDVNLRRANVDVTDEVGKKRLHGLESLLAREQAVPVPESGPVYAAGELATMLAKTASAPGAVEGGLASAFIDFGVDPDTAHAYGETIGNGGLVVFVRTEDERSSRAANILRGHQGTHVANFGP